MDQVTIQTRANGPYLVKGPLRLVDAEGNEFRVERDPVALCRCGGSKTKPFCDGTHAKVGFQAAEKAAREADRAS
ncbi:MAG: CDGSH iron-sulfur domain-containing protein [Candidatus Rokubacteria bacterium]|nr:CDGSH iron-sulfur domain-containing protein [Candidatus Rokubacteria bacterium]